MDILSKGNRGVGIMDFKTTQSDIPCRLFYPSISSSGKGGNVGWFVRTFEYFIEGYLLFLFPSWRDAIYRSWIVSLVVCIVSFISPDAKRDLPYCTRDATPDVSVKDHPLIVYSHGLTGSGEEHALMFALWAQQGYVVACIHHCDGSSCSVPRRDSHLLYKHADMKNYDKNFRPNQIKRREAELYEMYSFVTTDESVPSVLRDAVDTSRVVVAGFSYGAATAALSSVKRPGIYSACILLDGWFHIEVGDGFDFPAEAHSAGLNIPALFIGSEQFSNRAPLSSATHKLAKSNKHHFPSEFHVLEGSKHQNFTDVGYWLPVWLLRYARAVGHCDYHVTYKRIFNITCDFLHRHTKRAL